ncbi:MULTISPECIES: hypothetical protein [unclassified Shewanella]|uniref:hypothetical protein n=1 Tax=unclassified Shewanella TaxID=196818 RepID=UPI0020055417|nr:MULTISPECIES: hypothetical protein [unclassified Shewanella]MCK7633637.1 hypothetical protein [Shewanella sp. JNE17]MCK7648980.1 hypothetical protein [Shewanella sp. JNE8]MCK7656943.1 hypothetical protein [Shewanella sp. JNE4-2]UPO32611.1 hypothetical protein MZ182_07175 [Shewanella sp. JNE2]
MATDYIEHIETHKNIENGVQKTTKTTTISKVKRRSTPLYSSIFHESVDCLTALPSTQLRVMLQLQRLMTIEHHTTIDLSTYARKRICKALNIRSTTLSNALSHLRKKSLIRDIDSNSGLIQINPYIFWRGDLAKVHRFRDQYAYEPALDFDRITDGPLSDRALKSLEAESNVS